MIQGMQVFCGIWKKKQSKVFLRTDAALARHTIYCRGPVTALHSTESAKDQTAHMGHTTASHSEYEDVNSLFEVVEEQLHRLHNRRSEYVQ